MTVCSCLKHCRIFGFTILLTLPSLTPLFSQDRCGTVEYNKMISGEIDLQKKQDQFEDWMLREMKQKKTNPELRQSESAAEIVEIPIVIHIIHNNEPVGTGANIADAQIQSQIDVINEDFRRRNADRSNTPANFAKVAADTQIEFSLAKRDPQGLPTKGILRVPGTKSSYHFTNDNTELKSLSYWPAKDYLNIWVTTSSSKLQGHAQLPISSLDGLESASPNASTDGIVVHYRSFGSIDKYPAANLRKPYDKGRTTTHEIGHFLGLRHIWGDNTCETDYCDDTPHQYDHNKGCPTYPRKQRCQMEFLEIEESPDGEMFQNFMDYTDDACMNLFTIDQKDRMRTVLDNSPRRKSLTTSLALSPPVVHSFDLGILSVSSPDATTCNKTPAPSVIVKNYGKNSLNIAQVSLSVISVNGNLTKTRNADLGGMNSFSEATVIFSEISLAEGINTLRFEILTVNGAVDENSTNNTFEYKVNIASTVPADITEDFQNGLKNMIFSNTNTDGRKTWQITDAPNGTNGNKALYINYFDYVNEDAEDWLLSPVMDFSTIPFARLLFDYAYTKHTEYPRRNDQLKVLYSDNCGESFKRLFDKSGIELMTTKNTHSGSFIPNSANDWENEAIDLSHLVGKKRIQIAFVGKNAFGNNIYLDNISLITSKTTSVKLRRIDTPSIVSAGVAQPVNISVKNVGYFPINALSISYSIDSEPSKQTTKSGLGIKSGQSDLITIGEINSTEGFHKLFVTISKPNGIDDDDISDNTLSANYIIDLSSDIIPLRQQFEKTHDWVIATRSGVNWESFNLEGNTAMRVNSAQNTNIGAAAYLFSPILDLSNVNAASLFFDLSYAQSARGNSEKLKLLLSKDGGVDNYPHNLYDKSGSNLLTYKQVQNNWIPKSSNTAHWNSAYIDLSPYAGEKNIRLAFQLTNGNGNNLYLDNIELFTSADPQPFDTGAEKVSYFPNPIYPASGVRLNVVFNLAERQKINIRIIGLTGNLLFNQTEPYALNQTFTYNVSGLPAGMLVLSVTGESFRYHSRIIVVR